MGRCRIWYLVFGGKCWNGERKLRRFSVPINVPATDSCFSRHARICPPPEEWRKKWHQWNPNTSLILARTFQTCERTSTGRNSYLAALYQYLLIVITRTVPVISLQYRYVRIVIHELQFRWKRIRTQSPMRKSLVRGSSLRYRVQNSKLSILYRYASYFS